MLKVLDDIIKSKKIPHALLFVGRDLVSLQKQAYVFASKIILNDLDNQNCDLLKKRLEEHACPSIYEYYPKGKLELHSIDTIRQLISEAWKPNFDSLSKVFIIYSADKMLPSAASALLKIFEEPQDNVFIILVSSKIEKLSSPIISRSVIFTFKQENLNFCKIQMELFKLIEESLFVFSYSKINAFYQNIEAIAKNEREEREFDILKQEIEHILEVIYLYFRDKFILDKNINKKLLSFPQKIEVINKISPIPIEKVYLVIQQAGEALERSTNKRFILEWVFLQIEKLSLFYKTT